jgi:putative endonuclease
MSKRIKKGNQPAQGGQAPHTHQQRIGRWGEAAASGYLERQGYLIVARNARTRYGEIDLIVQRESTGLVFVEVKTRSSLSFGNPEEAVDSRKLDHLVSAAQAYLADHPQFSELDWRVDIVAIQGRPGAKFEDVHIEHFENIAA